LKRIRHRERSDAIQANTGRCIVGSALRCHSIEHSDALRVSPQFRARFDARPRRMARPE
jgi:hypothetical protein